MRTLHAAAVHRSRRNIADLRSYAAAGTGPRPCCWPWSSRHRLHAARPYSEQLLLRWAGLLHVQHPYAVRVVRLLRHTPNPRAATGVAPFTTRSSSRLRNGRCTAQAGKGATDRNVQSAGSRLQLRRTSPGAPAPGDDGADRHRRCTPIVVSTDSGPVWVVDPSPLRAELLRSLEALYGAVSASERLDRLGARRASKRRRWPYGAGKDHARRILAVRRHRRGQMIDSRCELCNPQVGTTSTYLHWGATAALGPDLREPVAQQGHDPETAAE